MMEFKILLVHGPNLNLLGKREPRHYGSEKLESIDAHMKRLAGENNAELRTFQSNSEGALIDAIHDAGDWADGLVINPGAYSHYSYAIRDAIAAVGLPAIEVHLSNIYAREEFRHTSVISPVAIGCIAGLGWRGYACGIQSLIGILQDRRSGKK
ncbi:MAG TPA: type II 3-dehydroquinate dehydratase [Acidobacteriota bacterium]|nr:type II 3-dehydroquinate dehydratase [Acidobacteriota bacterium]